MWNARVLWCRHWQFVYAGTWQLSVWCKRTTWYLRHHVSDDHVACFIVLRWRREGRSEIPVHFYQTTRLHISDNSDMNVLKFSWGVRTLLSVGIRLMIPDLELHHALLLVIDGDGTADECWSGSDDVSRSWTARERNERAGIMEQSNKCVIYEWKFRPPVITSLSREPRGRPALYHREPAHACLAWIWEGGLLLQQKLLTSSIPSKDEYLLRTRVE